jgi:integrase
MGGITGSDLRKYQAKLSQDVSPSRVNTIMQLLRSILEQAYREGDIDTDPAKAVKRVQEPRTKIDPLSEEELTRFLSTVDRHYKPIFTALAYTGARPNELQALRWSDIDWQKKTISISKGRVRGKEGLPKTKSSEREIPMVPLVESELMRLKDSKDVVAISEHVFLTKSGNPIDKHLDRIWTRGLKKAGMRHRPSYQLRHTFATHCLVKGLPLPYVARLLGHSTMDTTIRHYASWVDSATAEHDNKLRAHFTTAVETTGHKTGHKTEIQQKAAGRKNQLAAISKR